MISVTVIAVGKIKEKFFSAAVEEYGKRLGRYCNFKVIEVKDEPTVENPSERERELILIKEGKRIEEKIPKGAYVVSLCVEGKQESSEGMAELLTAVANEGWSHIVFIIGGSFGLSEDIKKLSKKRLSFSKMTFPHQLMRVILSEQIYRAFTIIEGKTYHK